MPNLTLRKQVAEARSCGTMALRHVGSHRQQNMPRRAVSSCRRVAAARRWLWSIAVSDKEVWKPVVKYESRYEVSSNGRVRRVQRVAQLKNGRKRSVKPLIMKLQVDAKGYQRVTLYGGHKPVCKKVSVLVCQSFHGDRPSGNYQCAHNDGDRTNDCAKNLRWATPSENARDKDAHKTQLIGSKNPSAKLTRKDVETIWSRSQESDYNCTRLAKEMGVSKTTIQRVLNGRHWKHIKPETTRQQRIKVVKIKAYIVTADYADVSEVAFAESPSQAKSFAATGNWFHDAEYTDLRARRAKGWDKFAGNGTGLAEFDDPSIRRHAWLMGWFECDGNMEPCSGCGLYEWDSVPESKLVDTGEALLCLDCRKEVLQ